jgi:ketosteroid isomerase-like protein
MSAYRYLATAVLAPLALAACAGAPQRASQAELERQVADTERAFARTMTDRDFGAFQRFIADEAIFFSGKTPLRGKAAVAENWKRFYEKPEAPFSWKPEQVSVLESGTLALSTGPVYDPSGKHFADFQSVWRQESPGVWRIVLDRGNTVCDCAQPQ